MKSEDRDRRLLERLRTGDPASGQELDAKKSAHMRERIRHELGRNGARSASGALLWGTASAAVILVALLVMRDRIRLPNEEGPGAAPVRTTISEARSTRPVREIHFVTEKGTRVVWTLDPDFDLQ